MTSEISKDITFEIFFHKIRVLSYYFVGGNMKKDNKESFTKKMRQKFKDFFSNMKRK